MRILIFGLSGSGKSTLSTELHNALDYSVINGDDIRSLYDDWDFSIDGRMIQAERMNDIANNMDDCIIDFIAPLQKMRDIIDADFVIWVNTIQSSEYADTDAIFEEAMCDEADFEITNWDYDVSDLVDAIKECQQIINDFNSLVEF